MERRLAERERPIKVEFEPESYVVAAMDDIFNLNSVLTFAVFVGISQASPGSRSLENRDECNAGPKMAKMLIVYEVLAFSFFLFSSLFAKLVKLLLSLNGKKFQIIKGRDFNFLHYMWHLTAMTSVIGIVLLMLSVVNLVQIQIGLYSCGSSEARIAIWGLCTVVGTALITYVLSLSIGIYGMLIEKT
ncbi:hypothetical protein DCAR_0314114 [Daucus carota subsp. sativus]|uniref:Uncharacterized protein n=1 Tax=Daucus carota subsp. sativus TaxID=79200 RepID=A0A166CFE6_DAUCS|nr:hypothetical protein DCAR_0314114 [Daucus carota subsp. sativus]